jgi:hypothetical protein
MRVLALAGKAALSFLCACHAQECSKPMQLSIFHAILSASRGYPERLLREGTALAEGNSPDDAPAGDPS